ncbi:hypothetical protein HAX54_015945 [Datura stramonium]|uniref:Uncharacterized protein n=1 Tax=Datura stramonium TaxID=4076 RepID=A0ABS8Y5E6_DATST|nr:hypothetical protein [Datura stramonium]
MAFIKGEPSKSVSPSTSPVSSSSPLSRYLSQNPLNPSVDLWTLKVEICGRDVFAEDGTAVEGRIAPSVPFTTSTISSLVKDHELLCTEVKDLRDHIERNEEAAAARHNALVALIKRLS